MSSADFEWQTDEEQQEVVVLPIAEPAVRRQWPWRLLLAILLLAAAVYGGIRWRTARQMAAITTDVKIAHALVQEAEMVQDVEMLNLVLSGRDLAWQEAQQQLMMDGHFAARPAFGLQAVPITEAVTQVTLSPDLAEAMVSSPRTFQTEKGESVLLQQTAVYRQGARNWVLAPPTDDFWGRMLITTTQYFTATYPQRDEIIVTRLISDLDALFADRLCIRILQCGPDVHFDVRFSTSPQSLITTADPMGLLLMGEPIVLATPTLVGLPLDEASYETLYKGYGAQVVTAALSHLFEYECCQSALMEYALLTKQASELGLLDWPLTSADYRHLLNFTFGVKTPQEILAAEDFSSPEDRQQAFALVDFLEAETEWNPAQLEAALLGGRGAMLYLPQLVREGNFADRWLAFIYEQSSGNRQSSSLSLPSAIQAACDGPRGATLHRYDLSTGAWSSLEPVEPPYAGETKLWPLPMPDSYLVYQQIYRRFEMEARMTLHYQNEDHLLLQSILTELYPLPQYQFADQIDVTGRYVTLFAPGRTRFDPLYFLLDLTTCDNGRCQIQTLFGRPVWSPDGRQLLVEERPSRTLSGQTYGHWQRTLSRREEIGDTGTEIGIGYAPRWLDDTHYSYLRLNNKDATEWVVASAADDVPTVQLETETLLMAVAATERPQQLFIIDTVVATPDQLAIISVNDLLTDSPNYVFLWDRINTPQLVQIGESLQVTFSPDGRWLTVTAPNGDVTLTDTVTRVQQHFHSPDVTPDWTADSQWLLTGRGNYLLLTAPDTGYQQLVLNENRVCNRIVLN